MKHDKQSKLSLRLAILSIVFLLLVAFGVMTTRVHNARAQNQDFSYEVEWAAVSDDLISVTYVLHLDPYAELKSNPAIAQGFYFPVECPVSSAELLDENKYTFGDDILTSCQRIDETQFRVSHFAKGDFSSQRPKLFRIDLGSQKIHLSGSGEPLQSKDFGVLELTPEFEAYETLLYTATEERTEGKLGIDRVELLYAPQQSILMACLSLPDNSDWLPEVMVSVNDTDYETGAWTLLDYKDPAVYEGNHRCYRFQVEGIGLQTDNLHEAKFSFSFNGVTLNIPECFSTALWARINTEIDFSDLPLNADSEGYVCPMATLAQNEFADPRETRLYEWLKSNLPQYIAETLTVTLN